MRFVVLGDLHYSGYSQASHCEARDRLFRAFFEQVAALNPDIIFAIGDVTNHGTLTELEGLHRIAKEYKLPFICVTGNHDINSLEKTEIAQFFLGNYPSASADEIYTSFDWENLIHFVLLDTARVKLSDVDWSGFVSQQQLAWFKNEVESFNHADAPQYLMVFGHHPIYDSTDRSKYPMMYIANSDEVYAEFAGLKRGPGIYFCGHNHSHSLAGPDSNNWFYVQSGDPLDCRSFRLVTVTPEAVKIQTIDFDLSNPLTEADFITTRLSITDGSFEAQQFEEAYGTSKDHSLNIKSLALR